MSSASALPVRSATGMSRVRVSDFNPLQKVMPSTPGIPTSSTITSGCRAAILLAASVAFSASSTAMSAISKLVRKSARRLASSSTTRMRMDAASTIRGVGIPTFASSSCSRRRNQESMRCFLSVTW
jgi:hypothetical protein